jgi:predicted RNase H-like nuclease (RuvC/YqgF family)
MFSGQLVLDRTAYQQVIDVQDDLTALGLISRLEYILDRFEADIEEQTRRAADATQRLAGYEPRLGEVFPLQPELDEKLARMTELEADLAKTESAAAAAHTDTMAEMADPLCGGGR